MKTTLLFTTLVAGLALAGCNKSTRTSTADTTMPPPAPAETAGQKIDRAGQSVADASRDVAASMRQAGSDVSARMTEWRLSASDIEADVAANRAIVRTRSDAVSTAAIDEDNLEKSIKGRLNTSTQLADLKFDVNANKQGQVELEGKARTTDQIAHAIATALNHEGVTQVTSKIKLDPDAGPNRR
jgi:osmotically-inducible protein OsmY